jgi:hypothetical protein
MMRSEWMVILECTTIRSITWIYCTCHAGVRGNEETDNLAGQAPIDEVLCLGRHFVKGFLIISKRLRMKTITTMCIYRK